MSRIKSPLGISKVLNPGEDTKKFVSLGHETERDKKGKGERTMTSRKREKVRESDIRERYGFA